MCVGINFVFELLQRAYDLNEECYRLLLFRYTMLIAFGCYLMIGKRAIGRWRLLCAMGSGIIYVVLFQYMGFVPIITRYWSGTCFFACLYVLPILMFVINSKIQFNLIELLGKASYNIFLVQMIYFDFAGYLYGLIHSRVLQLLLSIAICCLGGVLYYFIEQPITKYIKDKVMHRIRG